MLNEQDASFEEASELESDLNGSKVAAFAKDQELVEQAKAGALNPPPSNLGSNETGELKMNESMEVDESAVDDQIDEE